MKDTKKITGYSLILILWGVFAWYLHEVIINFWPAIMAN